MDKSDRNIVDLAQPYRENALGYFGSVDRMLLRQYRFPHKYSKAEKFISIDSDQADGWNHEYFGRIFGKSDIAGQTFEFWLRRESQEKLMVFLKKITRADLTIDWTGFRVMARIDFNGGIIFTVQLFARNPDTSTRVYTGEDAPNVVKQGPKSCF